MSIIDTLKSMIGRAKELHDLQAGKKQEAFRKCAEACISSRALLCQIQAAIIRAEAFDRDLKLEAEIAHMWADVSAAFLHIDSTFSRQCLEIAKYWTDPRADPVRDDGRLRLLFDSLRSTCHPRAAPGHHPHLPPPRVVFAIELMTSADEHQVLTLS